ncbi:stage II sporulation protein M [Candidatus Woesearchaeota archaeon]|nr:stage II sporulation protein M [Candidatus Woesearchaeota archaeon]
MVLESLVGPKGAEKRPYRLLFIGFLYSILSVFLARWIFKEETSLVMVFLSVIAAIPLVYKTIKYEEKKDQFIQKEAILIKEHGKAVEFLIFLFIGMLVGYTVWYLILSPENAATLFKTQLDTIKSINTNSASYAFKEGFFMKILINNLKVLFFCIAFSFFYGAGAIFILTWNASVISAAIGSFATTKLSELSHLALYGSIPVYTVAAAHGILRYMTHGIFEIAGYFIGALAGGIISVASIRHAVGSKKFNQTVIDSLDLIFISIAVLIVAALIEVYVTPLLF